MALKNNIKNSPKVVQDWTDYDKSLLHSISSEYFMKKGIDAFDNREATAIPNSVSNSYPHALSLVRILKANLREACKDKVRVLECGSGAGVFARHFLIAAREEGILERVEYFLSDIASYSLNQILAKGTLDEFKDLDVFRCVTVRLPDLGSALDLDGNKVDLEDLDLVIANYVVDALPMIPLKKRSDGGFDKLQLKMLQNISSQKEIDLVSDLGFLANLNIQERWVIYDLSQAGECEKKYFSFFKSCFENYPVGAELRFSYFTLSLIDSLKSKLKAEGLFYIYDLPSVARSNRHYCFYANSVVNFLNEELIVKFVEFSQLVSLAKKDHLHVNLLISNSSQMKFSVGEAFKNEFLRSCHINLYNELVRMIEIIKTPQSAEVLKFLVDKFQEIDGKSALSLTVKGLYHEMTQDYHSALETYNAARRIDFLNECLIDPKIAKLEAFLNSQTPYHIV